MKEKLRKISKFEFELPKEGSMKVPAKAFISEKLLRDVEETAVQQLANIAKLPGILKYAIAMPDVHSGYGFPIGGVAAFDMNEGIISPGGVGYDINCSVRLLKTDLTAKELMKKRTEILNELFSNVPSGVGRAGKTRQTRDVIKDVLEQGAKWAVRQGFGTADDWKKTEEEGCMKTAKASEVSARAIERGMPQLGSLGAGNHFLEIQEVSEIYDERTARMLGITEKGQVMIMVHCGSRGLGHQVASDYIKLMEDKYGFKNLPDRELINAPIMSDMGQKYYAAMSAAANFAFCNKQMITHWIREVFSKLLPCKIGVVYDVCHNIAKIEKHRIDDKIREVCVHRKGATRSFGAGREEIPEVYRDAGQPIILPGSMGTSSYVLLGTKTAEEISFASTAHGAGRVSSRSAALREFRGEQIRDELAKKNIEIKAASWKSIAEEAPQVYKDIDEVVKVSHEAGIGKLVAKLKPIAVMKG
ncbi:MAG: RtcB family protein [archaeon]